MKIDFGILATLGIIFSVSINAAFVIYRRSSLEESFYANALFIIGAFVFFNVLGNMYKAVVTDTTIKSIDLPTVLLPEWRFCSWCQQNAPPRC